MADVGRYCKAYQVESFRKFPQWKENLENLRKETKYEDGKEIEIIRNELTDDDVLYLQEDFVVTDGIFKNECVIFGDVTDEWKAFCTNELDFAIPDYVTEMSEDEQPASDEQTADSPATES